MNLTTLYKAVDAVITLGTAAKRVSARGAPEQNLAETPPPGIAGHIEARLTNVLVAALKEAFDRDHARLELERAQLEEQRRRAEAAMRMELRRQTVDRETSRLRLLAGGALVGWLASVLLLAARSGDPSALSSGALGIGWVLLLASLAAAFSAQSRLSASMLDDTASLKPGVAGVAAPWLLVTGLALAAVSLLL